MEVNGTFGNPPPPKKKKNYQKKPLKKDFQCKVCQDSANKHYHFGASCICFSCKAFFRRIVRNNINLPNKGLNCDNDDKCVINVKSRTSCSSCRFKKCIEVGLDPNLVRPKAVKNEAAEDNNDNDNENDHDNDHENDDIEENDNPPPPILDNEAEQNCIMECLQQQFQLLNDDHQKVTNEEMPELIAIENVESAVVEQLPEHFTIEYVEPNSSANQVVKMIVKPVFPMENAVTSLPGPIQPVKLEEPDQEPKAVEQVKEEPKDAKNVAQMYKEEAKIVLQNLTVLESQLTGYTPPCLQSEDLEDIRNDLELRSDRFESRLTLFDPFKHIPQLLEFPMTVEEESLISNLSELFNSHQFHIRQDQLQTVILCMNSGMRLPDEIMATMFWGTNRRKTSFFTSLECFEKLGPQDQLTLLGSVNKRISLLEGGYVATPMRKLSQWEQAFFDNHPAPKRLNYELNQVKPPLTWYENKEEARVAEVFLNDVIRLGMDATSYMLTLLCVFFKSTSTSHIEDLDHVQKTHDHFCRLLLRHLCSLIGRHYVEHLYNLHQHVISQVDKLPELKPPKE